MRAHLLLWWAAIAGCSGAEKLHWPPPPATPGARSILIVLTEEEHVSRFGFDLDGEGALVGPVNLVTADGSGELLLTAFYYDRSLAELGLNSGVLPAVDDCLLTKPMLVVESSGGEWTETADAIDRLLVPEACRRSNACRNFRVSTQRLETVARVRILIPLDDERALVATEDGLFYESTAAGVSRLESFDGLPQFAAMIDASGELWLGGDAGRIVRGPISGPFTELDPIEPDGTISAIAQLPSGRVLAVSVISSTVAPPIARALEIVPERRALGQIMHLEIESILSELVPFGERALAAVGAETAMVIDGNRTYETTPAGVHPLGRIRLTSAGTAFGEAFLGASGGLVYHAPDLETWRPIDEAPLGTATQALVAFERGLLIGSDDGAIGQHHPLRAPCAAEGYASIEIHHMVLLGGRVVLAGGPRDNPVNLLYWLEPL